MSEDQSVGRIEFKNLFYKELVQEFLDNCRQDLLNLSDIAGISATNQVDHATPFAEDLVRLRRANVEQLPATALDAERLACLAGAGPEMMKRLFNPDFEAAAAGPQLDVSAEGAREEVIKRVLQDTSGVIEEAAKWLQGENQQNKPLFSYGHWLAQNTDRYFTLEDLDLRKYLDGMALFKKINERLEALGLEPMPESIPSEAPRPDRPTEPGAHLKLV